MKSRVKKKSRILCFAVGIMLLSLLLPKGIYAAGTAAIMEVSTGDSEITVFVKGMGEESGQLSVQIGTAVCEDVSITGIKEKALPMQTLIMIDNSISIPEKARGQITEILQNLIADRLAGEETAVAAFSEDVTYLTDYTSDYAQLKSAVESIDYYDQETYLTDVLYDLLSAEYISKPEDTYRRIIVISDGVDNKSIGYTKEELYTLLRENPVPVYSIGIGTGKNDEQLENMFAISRVTGAESFLLGEMENVLDINSILNEDREILEVKIRPDADLLDGTRKSVKLISESGQSLAAEIYMPQKESRGNMSEEIEQPNPTKEPEAVETVAQPTEEKTEKQGNPIVLLLVILAAVAAGAGIICTAVLIYKKKKNSKTFEPITEDVLSELKNSGNAEYEKTEIVGVNVGSGGSDTFMIWNSDASYSIVLTDVVSPARTFQIPLINSVIIGRKEGVSDIVIDYNRTVSGKHCRIDVKDGHFFITDLQSANRTFVNECEILCETEIFSGDILKLGNAKLKFEVR